MKIEQKASPNCFSRNGWKPDMIVCHIAEGTYDGTIRWLCNPASQTSSHFVVGKDGRIAQLVPLDQAAWCNGTSMAANDKRYFGKSTLETVRERKTNANYYTISIEHEGYWKDGHGKLTAAQQEASVGLIRYIRTEIKRLYGMEVPADREHIVGHYEINPITKPCCPGECFPFGEILEALGGQKESEKLYRVQVGAFQSRENAQNYMQQLRQDGYPAMIVTQ